MAAADPIRKKEDVAKMAAYWLNRCNPRNHALIFLGVYSALKISDLLALTWDSVYDFAGKNFKSHIALNEKKTGKQRRIAINAFLRHILKNYFRSAKAARPGDYLFRGKDGAAPISRVRAYKIIKQAARAAGVKGNISCHSLKKTFGYHAWQKQVPIAVIMEIFNYSSFVTTRRYLGIRQEELDRAQGRVFAGWEPLAKISG